MKLRNRILAILLTLAMILSVMPMVFAAEKLTVTLSTPSGNVAYPVAAGSEFTFPEGNNLQNLFFVLLICLHQAYSVTPPFISVHNLVYASVVAVVISSTITPIGMICSFRQLL